MRKGELTRQHIIEKSAPLFNRLGYSTSLSELMKATGLEKGGIYRHFANKEELACEAFEFSYQAATQSKFHHLDSLDSGLAKVQGVVKSFFDLRSPIAGGCPVYNTAVEHDDQNPVLKKRAQKALQTWVDMLAGYIDQAKKEDSIRKDTKSETMATFLLGSIEGMIIACKLLNSSSLAAESCQELLAFIDSKRTSL